MLYYKFLRPNSIYYFCEIEYIFKTEQWKPVVGYEGLYEVSDLGRVKSLKRIVFHSRNGYRSVKEKILKQSNQSNYLVIRLAKNNETKVTYVHKVSSMSFLGHVLCENNLVINHIDTNKLNNKKLNLEITTIRINSNRAHLKSTSKYIGVCWEKSSKKWVARIHINRKRKTLGRFTNEIDASNAYQKALLEVL